MKKKISVVIHAGLRTIAQVRDQMLYWNESAKDPKALEFIIAVPHTNAEASSFATANWGDEEVIVSILIGKFKIESEAFNAVLKKCKTPLLVCISEQNGDPQVAWDSFLDDETLTNKVVKVNDGALPWTVQTIVVGREYARERGRVMPEGYPNDSFAFDALTHEADIEARLVFINVSMPKNIPTPPNSYEGLVVYRKAVVNRFGFEKANLWALSPQAKTQGHVEFLRKIGMIR